MPQTVRLNALTKHEKVAVCSTQQLAEQWHMRKHVSCTDFVWVHLLLGQAVLVKLNQRTQELRVGHHRLGARPADVLQVAQDDHTLAHLVHMYKTVCGTLAGDVSGFRLYSQAVL